MNPQEDAMTVDAVDKLRDAVGTDPFWLEYLERCDAAPPLQVGLHLGVFIEPFLQHILDGTKTIEARFSERRCAPYRRVEKGDILLLKKAGGPVVGLCEIGYVWSYRVDPESLRELRREFAAAMCAADDTFWTEHHSACYATLLRLEKVQQIPSVCWDKRDRRGWVVIRRRTSQLTLW
jgi:hypothetical protein